MKIKTFTVEIWNIEISDTHFSFDFKVYDGDYLVAEDKYESSHARKNDKAQFLEDLENGYAFKCALSKL